MLRDITIGQHFPGSSPVHRLDPRIKIILTVVYIVVLFCLPNISGMVVAFGAVLLLYLMAGIPVRVLLRSMKPILPILLFTAIFNLFFAAGEPIFQWWIFKLTKEGIRYAVSMMLRILCLIAGSSLLTYTTSPIVLTDALERLMKPLAVLRLPVHELAMMMTIALRFIPTLIEETDKIISAQKARGADMESGSLGQRVKALIPVLIPLFISAFRRADELAMAMECRCYHGGEGRTRLRQLHLGKSDGVSVLVFGLLMAAVIATGLLPF